MVGARDMVFPYLNMVSFWMFFIEVGVLLASFFVPGGPTGSGWTLYPPQAILEGTPGSEFGSSISVSGNYMAVGAPGMYHCEGAIYIFEKSIRNKTTPWYRISDSHDDFCFNERSDNFLGFPVCDKLEELNKTLHRWKIESATPDEYPLTYFSDDADICEDQEIVTFDNDSVSNVTIS